MACSGISQACSIVISVFRISNIRRKPSDKLADAGQVHAFTGFCPSVAVHVLWDFRADQTASQIVQLGKKYGVRIGAINPNLFQDQIYKYGSLCNREDEIRAAAVKHLLKSAELAKQTGSQLVAIWLADGSNYPGQANIRWRKRALVETLRPLHEALTADQQILLKYKPFEPAFYHTDLADWGMSYVVAKEVGPKARVLVDTGHHYLSQNIEQIVAEECLKQAFFADVRPTMVEWRKQHNLPLDPLAVFRQSGYETRVASERKARRAELGLAGSGSYA
jgi:L-rhamnose isomerase